MRLKNDSDTDEEDEQRPVRLSRSQWTPQDPGLVGVNTPEFIKPLMSDENRGNLEDLSTAYDYYKLFQSDGFANEVQSRLYGVQKGLDRTCHTSAGTHTGAWKLSCSTAAITLFQGGKWCGSSSRIATTTSLEDNIRRDTMDALFKVPLTQLLHLNLPQE
jgi:hypothetical protein